jgi:RND superfamily putative drug exporter
MVSRFREELAEGYDTEAAVRRTVMTSGRTVMFSAVILVASSVPLLLFPQGFLKSITYAIIASVMLAATLSVTVLPAALAILGPNVDALGIRTLLRVPFLRNWGFSRTIIVYLAEKTQKTKTRAEVEKGFWGKLVNRVMKRPGAFAGPIVIGMIVLIIPLGQLALGGISEKYLPPDNSVRTAQEEFDKIFPGFRTEPITMVIKNNNGDPITEQQIADVRNRAMSISGFTDPDNNPDNMWKERPYLDGASKDPSVRVIQNGLVTRGEAAKKIAELRALPTAPGITVDVGGTPALEQDSIHSLFAKLPLMALLLITTTTILMFLAFGSLVLPIKAALMSALTLGSTMGVLTWMFVDGHGSGLMNYTPQPLMAPMIGLIIAVIWGLSTDYAVFLVSRMVEARERGMSTTEAIRIGTATTGRLITGAALVLAVVAGAFVFSDLVMMKYLAFGLLIALLLDATIVRMFLVPAIMKMLGDDCWWAPRWMKRIQVRVGLGETHLPDERKVVTTRQDGQPVSAPAAAAVVADRRPPHDPTHPAIEGSAKPRATVRAAHRAPDADAPSGAGTTRIPTAPSPADAEPATTRITVAQNVKNVTSSVRNAVSNATHRTSAPAQQEREIESWLGELRGSTNSPAPQQHPQPVQPSTDATKAIPTPPKIQGRHGAPADVTTAIPAQGTARTNGRGDNREDTDAATEKLNARGKPEEPNRRRGGGVSAHDLLRREGRL